jgi:hypothetical protein
MLVKAKASKFPCLLGLKKIFQKLPRADVEKIVDEFSDDEIWLVLKFILLLCKWKVPSSLFSIVRTNNRRRERYRKVAIKYILDLNDEVSGIKRVDRIPYGIKKSQYRISYSIKKPIYRERFDHC